MNDQELNAIRALWDAMSEILEDVSNVIDEDQKDAAMRAIDEMKKAFPEEA